MKWFSALRHASLAIIVGQAWPAHAQDAKSEAVTLNDRGKEVVLKNNQIAVTLNKGASTISSIRIGDHDMVASGKPVYYSMGGGKSYRQPTGAAFRIVESTPEIAHVAFQQKWKPGSPQAVDIEVHYALTRGESGVYTYAILSHPRDYPDSGVGEWRMVWGMPAKNDREWLMEKIRVDPLRDWEMPSPADLAKAKPTGIKEIVAITSGPRAGMNDCKYYFNLEYHSVGCWGHASDKNRVGAWIVLGGYEFFNDGPTKQDLSSASGIIHIHFGRNHYEGSSTKLTAGEDWKKIYGPYLLYCNQGGNAEQLWEDARRKAGIERKKWPYTWVEYKTLYPPAAQRGSVSGKLVLRDPLKPKLAAGGAWVGVSQPDPGGNWQNESNRYQYWTKAAEDGTFTIPHVRPGSYTLSAFTDGVVEEFEKTNVTVQEGSNATGDLTWEVKHRGKRIAWEIGVPNRRASEFALGKDYFHGYGWDSFSKRFKNPLIYTIGKSDPAKDWNYAQGAYLKNGKVEPWPWEVRFDLNDVPASGTATLVVAWASAESARVDFELNGDKIASINPRGGGNALLRESVHAKYSYDSIDIPAAKLRRGANRLVLTQTRTQSAACHVMYDYLALELPEVSPTRAAARR